MVVANGKLGEAGVAVAEGVEEVFRALVTNVVPVEIKGGEGAVLEKRSGQRRGTGGANICMIQI